jgi:Arc/MetJ family transcription regulator
MSRTVIDNDDSALEGAMRELGTKTKVATVNKAHADVCRAPAAPRLPGYSAVMDEGWR